jgi:gliding motility-associated-like protein
MRFKNCLVILMVLLCVSTGHSQPCTTLGQNPGTAFPVCGTSTFTQNNVPICGGTTIPTNCTGGGYTDVNPFWYRFTCYTAGTLGFTIRPISASDDYDWVLFDITGRNASDVYTTLSLNIAENWSANPGNTGAANNLNSLRNCAGSSTPNFSSMPVLIVNHEYLLMVSNYSASQQGYSLNFNAGTAVITDPLLPLTLSASANCDGTQVTVRFNKNIKCNSLAANGSDFTIGGATISSATGIGCTSSFDLDSVLITLSAPLAPGNYTLTIANGSDGNTLLDNCGTGILIGNNVPFTVNAQNPLAMGTVTPPACAPTSVTLTFAEPIKCNSIAANGSDFTISGPSVVTISSATAVNCVNGETNTITLQFAASILTSGTYQVLAATGTDGNTLLGQCNRQVTAGSSSSFTLGAQAPITMGAITPPACTPSSVTLTFADPITCSTVAANGSDFTISGPSAVTITSATAVNCVNGETNTITLQFSAPILVSGTYQVLAATGSDGNTLLGQCGRQVTVGSNSSFTLAAQPVIAMGNITPPACTPSSITLTFADPITCSTVAANGSDFTINGPSAVTITSATAVNCVNGETSTITLQFSAPILVSGTYQVLAATGSDGNTLLGQCGRQVTVGSNSSFTLAAQAPIAMGSITPPPCTPSTITLTFADPITCNTIAANGSDFTISGPSAVVITSATTINCVNGETNTVTLQFASPVLTTGTYQVLAATGSDGNTLLGQCGRQVTAGSNSSFTLAAQAAIAIGTITPPPCIPTSVTLNFAEPVNCNSIAANGSDFTVTGPSALTITAATAVNCNGNGETNTITIQFSTAILVTGNYQVQVTTGADGNTLIGQCNRQVTAGSSTPFTLAAQPPMTMGTIVQPSCAPSSITINFTDPVNCTSISPNGSEFLVTGPSGVIITAAAGQCNVNPAVNTITIQFAAPVTTSGTYQLQIKNGADGNTLTGVCNRSVTAGDFTTFTIPDVPPVIIDSIVPVTCSPSSLRLILDAPIRCSSIAANGSDFMVTGPSPVTIASAAGTCDANGLTSSIDIQLASPIVAGGNYQLQLNTGSDGNTLLSECYRQSPAATLGFVASDTVSAIFQHQIQYDCTTDVITFSHDGQHNVTQWTWTINGTAASTSQTFTQNFSASSQNQVQLVVSNGACNDTYSESIVLNNKVTASFKGPDLVCPEDTASFVNTSTGQVDNWQWSFGNGNTSSLQNPPAQVYPLTGTEILYPVSLTVSNNTGCSTTATQMIKVLAGCIIAVPTAFTPNNDGLNDFLYPLNAFKAENLDFKVFNRWGELIFQSKDWTKKWDGKINGIKQATNVYVWTLSYTHRDTKIKYSLKGTTTLIR